MTRSSTRALPTIAVIAIGLGAALPIAAPASAREAGGTQHCLGEVGYQLPGTWHIEDSQIEDTQIDDGRTFEATGGNTGPGNTGPSREGASDEQSLQSDCALV
ncbi:MAG: hypothetical protein MI785_12970 [Kiloniellales bacterium]|nr:hypothetical protein [Kiloniellales bacterium]